MHQNYSSEIKKLFKLVRTDPLGDFFLGPEYIAFSEFSNITSRAIYVGFVVLLVSMLIH